MPSIGDGEAETDGMREAWRTPMNLFFLMFASPGDCDAGVSELKSLLDCQPHWDLQAYRHWPPCLDPCHDARLSEVEVGRGREPVMGLPNVY